MDRIDEYKHFSTKNPIELASELEAMYAVLAERLNFILDRVIEVVVDGVTYTGLETFQSGNEPGDDSNWFVTVNEDGDFIFMHKESGSWERRGPKHRG